jgi:hypothetical protein
MSEIHPDFEAAPKAHQWSGRPLEEMKDEMERRAAPSWWYILPHGAMVIVRKGSVAWTWQIRRRHAPATLDGLKRWRREMETFEQYLGLRYRQEQCALDGSTITAIYLVPLVGYEQWNAAKKATRKKVKDHA